MTAVDFLGILPSRRKEFPQFHLSRGKPRCVLGRKGRLHGVFFGFPPSVSLDLSYHSADILISTIMHSNKISFFLVVFLMFSAFFVSAESKTLVLGGAVGWPSLSQEQGIARSSGRLGNEALVLDSTAQTTTADLYLSFDNPTVADETGNYRVVSNTLLPETSSKRTTIPSRNSSIGRHGNAALCNTQDSGLVLSGKPGTLFGTSGTTGSFSIEFWLYPAVTENGSILFQWQSSRRGANASLYQYIRSLIMKNRVQWTFSNIWTSFDGTPIEVVLTGKKNLVPGQWIHHELSYDAVSGLLEYRVNGLTEDIRYITASGTERGDVYPAILGTVADIEIAPRFSGLIDEFILRTTAADNVSLDRRNKLLGRYPSTGGRFVTNPIDSGGPNSVFETLSADIHEPLQTGSAFFVRAGNNFYRWTDTSPAWVPVHLGEKITGVSGQYFQVAGELYPDGNAVTTPVLSTLSLHYQDDLAPWPPIRVLAEPDDGAVTLSWAASIDHDTAGYLVYYGKHPGEYLEQGSPMDAGNGLSVKIANLENGVLYFFSIAAYDTAGKEHQGHLSVEVHARPLAFYGTTGSAQD